MSSAADRPNTITVVAVAVVAYALSTVIHEGLGHGGACVLTGCRPILMTTMQLQGDETGLSHAAGRLISAGGCIANIIAATIAIALLRRRPNGQGPGWFFLWLFATLNLLMATGYFLYSGVLNIGDWSAIVRGLKPVLFWRALLTIVGGVTYWLASKWAIGTLAARLNATGRARMPEAYRYTLPAYIAGGILSITAGLLDPGGIALVLISGVAASLGGSSTLAWGPQYLQDSTFANERRTPLSIGFSRAWIALAVVVGAAFIFIVGPGIRFS